MELSIMADPKFANLPGIAYDQPDVYETPDVREPDTSDYYEEEPENEFIERLHISTKDSYNKFKGKQLSGNFDFSDRLGRRIKKGYDSWTNEYELVGEGGKETPIQKCRRLQCELNELMDEIATLNEDKQISKEEKESYEAVATVVNTARKVLDSLRLEQVLGKEGTPHSSEKKVKTLITQVEEFQKSGVLTPIPAQSNDLEKSTRIAALEHKLHNLEKAVGAKDDKWNRLTTTVGTTNLLEVVQQLSTKAALLQPNQLDLIEARLNNLVTKMDAIVDKSNACNQDVQRDQKVLELYEIAKRTEPVAEILPDMLERMQALEALHKYATNFTKIVGELEATQTMIVNGIENNKMLLQGIQEAFAKNLETVNKELTKIENRIKIISKE